MSCKLEHCVVVRYEAEDRVLTTIMEVLLELVAIARLPVLRASRARMLNLPCRSIAHRLHFLLRGDPAAAWRHSFPPPCGSYSFCCCYK